MFMFKLLLFTTGQCLGVIILVISGVFRKYLLFLFWNKRRPSPGRYWV